ncbi:hypothetical protein BD560DRAFT_467064 [Blakeslea trispora]|nr:hypothetical protein BD560DRAFT_467064 [Blakeslea trispora]
MLDKIKAINNTTCKLSAFLLGMTAFLQRSDLECLDLASISVFADLKTLYFKLVAPKLRNHQIIQHRLQPHSLLVNSLRPSEPVKTTTISTWLRSWSSFQPRNLG